MLNSELCKYLTISFLRFSSAQFQHSTVLQFRLHSYGYAPHIASCIALNLNTIIIKELIDRYLCVQSAIEIDEGIAVTDIQSCRYYIAMSRQF